MMLERLLTEIRSGGTLEIKTLAERLGTTPEMVEALLHHLTQIGTLKSADVCTDQACAGCSLSSGCHIAPLKLWKG